MHRLAGGLVPITTDPNDVFTGGGQVWRMIAPFVGTPIALMLLMPQVP